MAVNYLPLRKMEELEQYISFLDKNIESLCEHGFPKVKNYDEYIDIILKLYLNELNYEDFNKIMKSILTANEDFFNALGLFSEKYANAPGQMMTEIMDIIFMPYLLNIWRKSKQVYKPDADFCNALLKTENLIITKEMISHLPCKHFYIDLSNCDLFLPIAGIFVNVFISDDLDKVCLAFFLLSNDLTTWSSYDVLNFQEDKEIKISQKFMKELSRNINGEYVEADYDYFLIEKLITGKGNQYIEGNLDRYEASFFVYQLLTYMVSHEPQIEDSPITKSTYRPPKNEASIKNKFSEVQIREVGIRFGKSFRQQKKKYNCNTILTKHLETRRKSPIPHFRCAHWQGYWVGRGRTEHIVKWIEPIFVGGEDSNDVVIHKI